MSHLIDSCAYTNRLRGLPPSHKLVFAIVLLFLALISHPLVQLLIAFWLFLWVVIYAKIPVKLYLRLLLVPIGFWFMSLPTLVFNGVSLDVVSSIQPDIWNGWRIAAGSLYVYVSQAGLGQVGVLLARALATTSSMYFMLLTTPFTEVLQILKRLHCPTRLTELLLLTYHFIFTLLAIAEDLWRAQNSRGGYRTRRRGIHSFSLLVGQLLQRSLENYRQVSLTTAARGFSGQFQVWCSYPYQPSRRYILEAAIGCTVLMLLTAALY